MKYDKNGRRRRGSSVLEVEQFGPLKPKSQIHCPFSHRPFPEQSFGHFSKVAIQGDIVSET
jgi:hypothetical protein